MGVIRSFAVSGSQASPVSLSFHTRLTTPNSFLSSSSHIQTPSSKNEEEQKGERVFWFIWSLLADFSKVVKPYCFTFL